MTKEEKLLDFVHDVLQPLMEELGRGSGKGRPESWEDQPQTLANVEAVLLTMKDAFDRVYADFVEGKNQGLTLQNFMAFTHEFGILKELKLLTIQRIFAMLADEPRQASAKTLITLKPFKKSVVYLANAAIDGPYEPWEKLLLLGHLMNATPGAVRLAHARDLFPVAERVHEIRGPVFSTGESLKWANMAAGGPKGG